MSFFRIKHAKKLEDYELEEIYKNRLLINKYSLDLKYTYEIVPYWKEFFFDLLVELNLNEPPLPIDETTFDYLMKNWKTLISLNNLQINFNDYIPLSEYVCLDEWIKYTNHFLITGLDNPFLAISE